MVLANGHKTCHRQQRESTISWVIYICRYPGCRPLRALRDAPCAECQIGTWATGLWDARVQVEIRNLPRMSAAAAAHSTGLASIVDGIIALEDQQEGPAAQLEILNATLASRAVVPAAE